ncbi:tat pathway signal sequence [Sclerotinia borealis F-4128]|uniref:Tat pathway signal sequence n=1 Tax=Sclerotinia borealis (strain F-4128) TaxID=1432307 RepID=W9CIX2_SCLBF|nr:tat pathway signal sequence [Sclerotinia borealis F-4128]
MRTKLTDKIYVFEEIPRQAKPTSRTSLLASEYGRQEEEEEGLCSQILLVLVFFILFISICLIGFWIGGHWNHSPEGICTDYVSQYSPVLEDLSLSYTTIPFNGSLLEPNEYRQDAGPEVDAAWKNLGVDYRGIAVPAVLAAKSGLKADQVKINEKYGGGYPANVEGLHHLHCLNLLRQGLWYNYDYYHEKGEGAFKNDIPILKLHVSHCLDIIRQQLMCTVDIGVMGQVWVHPEAPEAYVDFNTKHRCRDFDAVRDWAEEQQMPADLPDDFLQPPKAGDKIYSDYP